VLSTGIAPGRRQPGPSGLLRSALTADGFFLEAHPKLRPVDLANEGEFICGLAHSPRFIDETIAQAKAAPAAPPPSCPSLPGHRRPGGQGQPAKDCVACATCVKVCPYGAPMINDLNKAEIQGAKCMGCGSARPPARPAPSPSNTRKTRQVTAMLDELLVRRRCA
jgi:heterodisulfide reductase subunit A